jgi:hypothetical protein
MRLAGLQSSPLLPALIPPVDSHLQIPVNYSTNQYLLHVQLTNSFHEQLAHIKHMNHGSQFQQLWSKLRSEVLSLQQRGYYGDGAYGTCGSSVSRKYLNAVPFPIILRALYAPNVFDIRSLGLHLHGHISYSKTTHTASLNRLGFIDKIANFSHATCIRDWDSSTL